jgi:hypothetical protein
LQLGIKASYNRYGSVVEMGPAAKAKRPRETASTTTRLLIAAVGVCGVPFPNRSGSAGQPTSLAHADEVDTVAPTPQVQWRVRLMGDKGTRGLDEMEAIGARADVDVGGGVCAE